VRPVTAIHSRYHTMSIISSSSSSGGGGSSSLFSPGVSPNLELERPKRLPEWVNPNALLAPLNRYR